MSEDTGASGNPVSSAHDAGVSAGAGAHSGLGSRVDSVLLRVDSEASEPPFRQLRDQILAAVRDGSLKPGTRMPAVRTLATEVGVAANTAAKVYRELEESGVLRSQGRAGTFVAEANQARAVLAAAATEYASIAVAAGFDLEQAQAALASAFPARPR